MTVIGTISKVEKVFGPAIIAKFFRPKKNHGSVQDQPSASPYIQ